MNAEAHQGPVVAFLHFPKDSKFLKIPKENNFCMKQQLCLGYWLQGQASKLVPNSDGPSF